MIGEAELVKGEVEGGLPDGEVGLVEIVDGGDVVADVDELVRSGRCDGGERGLRGRGRTS